MDANARLEANALVEALTVDGDCFDPAQARRLIALVPVYRKPPFWSVSFRMDRSTRHTQQGQAAGVGNVAMPEEEQKTIEWSSDAMPVWRAGGYKLTHEPGELRIDQPFTDTMEDDGANRRALLSYDKRSGVPRALKLYAPRILSFGPLRVIIGNWRPWKLPAQ